MTSKKDAKKFIDTRLVGFSTKVETKTMTVPIFVNGKVVDRIEHSYPVIWHKYEFPLLINDPLKAKRALE